MFPVRGFFVSGEGLREARQATATFEVARAWLLIGANRGGEAAGVASRRRREDRRLARASKVWLPAVSSEEEAAVSGVYPVEGSVLKAAEITRGSIVWFFFWEVCARKEEDLGH
ncbi:hypothetical protein U1Q18_048308 [Sarracenia purpurea var. burkii]